MEDHHIANYRPHRMPLPTLATGIRDRVRIAQCIKRRKLCGMTQWIGVLSQIAVGIILVMLGMGYRY